MDNKNLLQKIEIERQSLTTKIEESERFLVEARGKLQFIDSLLMEEVPRPRPIEIKSTQKEKLLKGERQEELILAVQTVLDENNNNAMTIKEITTKIDESVLWPSKIPKNIKSGEGLVRLAIKKTDTIRKVSDLRNGPSRYIIDTTKA